MSSTIIRKRFQRVGQYFSELWSRREFAYFLAMGNLKARNASTSLGLLWWVLNPLLLGMVYYLIFGVFFPSERDLGYLLSGMFVFHFTSQSMLGGANSIIQNAKLLVNLKFPRVVLPISNLIETASGFLVAIGVLFAVALPIGSAKITWQLGWFFLIFPLHIFFNLGLSLLTARLAVPFRDINNIIPYLTRLWLYVSPIIWPAEVLTRMPPTIQKLVEFNPLYSIIAIYRAALLGVAMPPGSLWTAAVWSVGTLFVGLFFFVRYEGRMVRYL